MSSSFDADRLDYLRRDRLMTGTGAGAIDFDWLLDNLRIADVRLGGDDDEASSESVRTFCLDEKALQAAESFLLARYHLFEQVYLHKTTRGMEALIRALLTRVAAAAGGGFAKLGLGTNDPLIRFFRKKGQTVENYLALDDFAVWTTIGRIAEGKDAETRDIARRLRERRLYKALDINAVCPALPGEDPDATEERRQRETLRIETSLKDQLGRTVLKDEGPISIYGEIGADEAKTHNMLSILLRSGTTREITQLSPTIRTLSKQRTLVRFYFKDAAARDKARAGGAS